MAEIDVRGYACPIPVVKTKKAIEQNPGQEITVLLDSSVSKENVSRLAESQGYQVREEALGDDFKLILKPGK